MQLIKRVNRIVDNKEYSKYELIIPPPVVEQLGWSAGEQLEHEVKNEALIVRRAKPVDPEVLKMASRRLRSRGR